MSLETGITALQRTHVEDMLLPILIQLIIIVLAARVFAVGFRKIGQPSVVGEIAAGILLGPSLLGQIAHAVGPEGAGWLPVNFWTAIFHPTIADVPPALSDQVFHWIFSSFAQIGLILLLFQIGLEFDFSHLRNSGRSALAISWAGIALPFALGLALAPMLLASPELGTHPLRDGPPPRLGFALFLGTALAITALPVLARIMVELNITRTRLAAVTITSAAADDATGWILLASVAALVQAQFQIAGALWMVGLTIAFALAMIYIIRPVILCWVRRMALKSDGELGVNSLAILLAVVFLCSIATNLIGIFAIFGAFMLGAVLSGERELRAALGKRLRDFVTAFFVPIFFTYTGLRTNITALGSAELWLLCGLVLLTAVVGKFGGCAVAARLTGFSTREAACIGAMMNTRGLMELVVVNVGYDLRILPPSVFAMLVLMAMITNLMTTPSLVWPTRGTEL